MKKFFLVAIMAITTMTASAQLITSSRVARGERAHNWWVDFGAGGFTGDADGAAIDLGLRYTKMWGNFGWDILKLSVLAPTEHFDFETMDIQLKTGLRYVSEPVTGNIRLYGNAAGGFWCDLSDNAPTFLAWEIGAGVMLNNRLSLGIVFNNHTYEYETYYGDDETASMGYLGARISYAF